MANYDVDVLVPQGQYNFVDSDDSIGTQGCGPCVGIIAKLNNGRIFCGHLDSAEIVMRKDKEKYSNMLRRFLRSILNPNMVMELYYVTDKATFNSKFSAESIERMFPTDSVHYLAGNDGLYYDGQAIKPLGWSDNLNGNTGMHKNVFSC